MNYWRQPIIDTIDLCVSRLPSTIHPTHIERINLVKNWLERDSSSAAPEPTGAADLVLNWTEQETKATAETAHGQAMIVEVQTPRSSYLIGRITTRYHARILHSTGAVLESREQFPTFEDAEVWIRTMITQLDDPQLEEANLESILFTLAICKQVLPNDTEPTHLANLQLLEEILGEALL
jgi:hypothetical protein